MLTDDNAGCADLDKSNAQVINAQFLSQLMINVIEERGFCMLKSNSQKGAAA